MPTNKISKHDLDVTPEELNAVARDGLIKATLYATGWTSSVPYSQTVVANGVKDGDKPIISCGEPSTLNAENFKALSKNYAVINRAVVSEDNRITFYCYDKVPTGDIPLFIKI